MKRSSHTYIVQDLAVKIISTFVEIDSLIYTATSMSVGVDRARQVELLERRTLYGRV